MSEKWEGRTVDGRFPLQRYLGGSDHSAVFLTLRQDGAGNSGKAVIKLIPADAEAEKQLLRWTAVRALNHPNLIRIFEAGRYEMDGAALLFVVMEYAEENLSQILPERALTAEETCGMLPPLLRALQSVHERGLVHGRIQPSNILAIADQVKLSSDSLGAAGEKMKRILTAYDPPEAATGMVSSASDVWQLGVTLVEVLTQHLPDRDRGQPSAPHVPQVGEPFGEIVEHCLQTDAGERWTLARILNRLEPDRPVSAAMPAQAAAVEVSPAITGPAKASAKWLYLLALAVLVAFAVFLIARSKPSSSPVEIQPPQTQQGTAAENTQPANSQSAQPSPRTETKPSPVTEAEDRAGEEKAPAHAREGDVVRRVVPQVSPSARRTIHGTIKVRVKVEVDAAGNVTEAKFESAGPSKYFSRLALEDAREWKFAPAPAGESGTREWTLQFAFSRGRTEASVVRTKRESVRSRD
jgi:TonB family protein